MNTFIALLKRECLEHKNIWIVPVILLVIAILMKLSLSFGNISVDFDLPEKLKLDDVRSSIFNGVTAGMLNFMHFIVLISMIIVSIFYALSSLYNERQDESVLFWRSLPISDSMTVASKTFIALIVIPVLMVICQIIMMFIFLGTNSLGYLLNYLVSTLPYIAQLLIWSLLPIITWCLFCSEIAKKNPFLLAFIAPLVFVLIDTLFLKGFISKNLVINRILLDVEGYSIVPLIAGIAFSAICIILATIKRSQRF